MVWEEGGEEGGEKGVEEGGEEGGEKGGEEGGGNRFTHWYFCTGAVGSFPGLLFRERLGSWLSLEHLMIKPSMLFECGPLPPLRPPCVHQTSFVC